MHVVPDEGDVEKEGEELARDEEEGVEEDVEDVLGEDERVEAVALVDRVLVVGLQLVERDDLRGNENYIMGEFLCQGLRDCENPAGSWRLHSSCNLGAIFKPTSVENINHKCKALYRQ